ncbi:MAG: metallophosphoesterase [Deltaproteobacteria bacterium]|nr:metallophosphoesterase [Deltaproteobacteria bacterium]
MQRAAMVGWYDIRKLGKTAVDVAISAILGMRADYRLLEALEAEQPVFPYDNQRDIWIDYVADTGDGWNPTYSVATLLARTSLEASSCHHTGQSHLTQRGQILVMGGDEVYPSASREAYQTRLVGPYECALEQTPEPHPHLFAIPGNHDWYDGLVAFTRLFCQERWVGGWLTKQCRSYFALKLPSHWWLLWTDIQLESDIDQPQLDYFRRVAEEMKPGDGVILCTAVPDWIYGNIYDKKLENTLAFLEQNVIEKAGAKVMVTLAGDLHHYRHHQSNGASKIHKITAGGGGAFLHPTHGPKVDGITIGPQGKQTAFTLKAEFPSRQRSRWLALRNIFFPILNPYFGILTGLAYLMLAWSLQGALKSTFQETPLIWGNTGEVVQQTLRGLASTPSSVAWVVALVVGFIFFTDTHSKPYRYIAGSLHALAHLLLNLALGWWVTRMTIHTLHLTPDSPGQIIGGAAGLFVGGYLAGSLLMGFYLLVSLNIFGRHANEAFSSLRIQGYKNFLRLYIDTSGRLTIYSFGIKTVPKAWVAAPHPGPSDPKLLPKGNKTIEACLIEEPIEVLPPWLAQRGREEVNTINGKSS